MTEDEAKTKWCPFARAVTGLKRGGEIAQVIASNRPAKCIAAEGIDATSGMPEAALCIGSACMAWRWAPDVPPKRVRKGYCGLAGKP